MERPDRTKEIFIAALPVPPGERRAWLEQNCGGDAELLSHVQSLLEAHDKAGSFLADAGGDVRRAAAATVDGARERVGEMIGAYKLLESIGEGGFGTVWMAEQREPVRRLVALKVLKAGMDSAQVVARFEQERQALALMTHPNIAQVFDAGTTPRGLPFFVMELVKGVPVTDYCAREKLPIRARLDLFVQVCRAVQHAHGKGLIHRDIKPRNVLVATADGKPLAKVIDFGIAKATAARLTDKTLFTEHRAMVGTLEYMSPEQAQGLLDVDTRSDVYSLGALLYELLTGSTPFDAKELVEAGYAEILRILRDVEPQRPSVRVSTKGAAGWFGGAAVASQRNGKELFGVLRGELDWVVMKALEKDRGRRYASADGLAEDVERYLAGDPVRAVPPSIGYRVRKFVRRNKALVTSSAAILLTVFVAAILTTGAMQRATNGERAQEMLKQVTSDVVMAARALDTPEGGSWLQTVNSAERLNDPDEIYMAVSELVGGLYGAITASQNIIEGQRDMARGAAYAATLRESLAYAAAERPTLAANALERCKGSLRNWEWFYARTALDDGPRLLANKESVGTMCDDGARYAFFDGTKIVVIRLGGWEVEAECPLAFDSSTSGSLRFPCRDRLVVETASVHWVLDPTTGTNRAGFDRSTAPPGSHTCAWTRGASRVATANDEKVVVWDVDTGARIVELNVEGAYSWSRWSFSHDGRFLAQVRTAASEPRSRVWRVEDGVCVAETKGTLTLNPFGARSLSSMGEVVDLAAGSVVEISHLADAVYEYCDTDLVVRTAKKRTAEPNPLVWEPGFTSPLVRSLVDGRVVGLPGNTLRADAGLQLTPDLARNYYCDINGAWGSICLSTGEDLQTPVFSWLHQSGDGKWLLNRAGRLYAMAARPPSRVVPTNRPVLALANAPTEVGPRTIARSAGNLRAFDEYTAACVETPTVTVDATVCSQDGRRFLERRANDLMVIHATTSQSIATLSADAAGMLAVAMSYDGSVAAACDTTSIRWWDVAAPTIEKRIALEGPVAPPVSLSVQGDRVALGVGGAVHLYSLQSSPAPAQRVMTATSVTRLLFQPDGSRLLVATSSGRLHVMNVPALDDSAVMEGHSGPVTAIAWSHDGDRVFSAGDDGTVRVWYVPHDSKWLVIVEGSLELLSLSDPEITGKPTCLLFPPDGERLICGYDDGSIRVWDSVPWSERVDRRNAAVGWPVQKK